MGGGEEVDVGGRVGQGVRREGHGQLHVHQLETLLLGRQTQDLVLEPLVLLLQRVQRLQHLHDYGRRRVGTCCR